MSHYTKIVHLVKHTKTAEDGYPTGDDWEF